VPYTVYISAIHIRGQITLRCVAAPALLLQCNALAYSVVAADTVMQYTLSLFLCTTLYLPLLVRAELILQQPVFDTTTCTYAHTHTHTCLHAVLTHTTTACLRCGGQAKRTSLSVLCWACCAPGTGGGSASLLRAHCGSHGATVKLISGGYSLVLASSVWAVGMRDSPPTSTTCTTRNSFCASMYIL
jgi:hypothetical protein